MEENFLIVEQFQEDFKEYNKLKKLYGISGLYGGVKKKKP